jgi:hypothetical protein
MSIIARRSCQQSAPCRRRGHFSPSASAFSLLVRRDGREATRKSDARAAGLVVVRRQRGDIGFAVAGDRRSNPPCTLGGELDDEHISDGSEVASEACLEHAADPGAPGTAPER